MLERSARQGDCRGISETRCTRKADGGRGVLVAAGFWLGGSQTRFGLNPDFGFTLGLRAKFHPHAGVRPLPRPTDRGKEEGRPEPG